MKMKHAKMHIDHQTTITIFLVRFEENQSDKLEKTCNILRQIIFHQIKSHDDKSENNHNISNILLCFIFQVIINFLHFSIILENNFS